MFHWISQILWIDKHIISSLRVLTLPNIYTYFRYVCVVVVVVLGNIFREALNNSSGNRLPCLIPEFNRNTFSILLLSMICLLISEIKDFHSVSRLKNWGHFLKINIDLTLIKWLFHILRLYISLFINIINYIKELLNIGILLNSWINPFVYVVSFAK